MIDFAFAGLVSASCGYAIALGQRDARIVAMIFLAAWLVSMPAIGLSRDAIAFNGYVLLVDVAMLGLLIVVASRTSSYWPIWVAGLHVANIGADLAMIADAPLLSLKYRILHSFWAVPELIVMPLGIYLDREARLRPSD